MDWIVIEETFWEDMWAHHFFYKGHYISTWSSWSEDSPLEWMDWSERVSPKCAERSRVLRNMIDRGLNRAELELDLETDRPPRQLRRMTLGEIGILAFGDPGFLPRVPDWLEERE